MHKSDRSSSISRHTTTSSSPVLDANEDAFGPSIGWTAAKGASDSISPGERASMSDTLISATNDLSSIVTLPFALPLIDSTISVSTRVAQPVFEAGASERSFSAISSGVSNLSLNTAKAFAAPTTRTLGARNHRLSSSVINSPSLTPPPSVSTAPGGRTRRVSVSGSLEPRSLRQSPTAGTSTITDAGEEELLPPTTTVEYSLIHLPAAISTPGGPEASYPSSVEAAISRPPISVKLNRPSSIITAAEIVPPQVSTEIALAHLSGSNASNPKPLSAPSPPSTTPNMSTPSSSCGSTPLDGNETSDSAVNSGASSCAMPSTPDTSVWSKRKPLSAEDAILRPLRIDVLPVPKVDEPLFLPVDADRLWYLGWVEPWQDFNRYATGFWNSNKCRVALDEIKSHPIAPPRTPDRQAVGGDDCSEASTRYFQREVLQFGLNIYNKITETSTMQKGGPYGKMYLGSAEGEDLGNDEMQFAPSFVVKVEAADEEEDETRLLGHVEYLGGRKDALTSAIRNCARNTWGSFRCVLGNVARYMLLSSTRYAFLVSADEIIFLKLDVDEKVEYDTHDGRDPVDLFTRPMLYYTDPIKFADKFDEAEGSLSLKVALLYVLHCAMEDEFQITADTSSSLNYAATTKAGEAYRPYLSLADLMEKRGH